MERKPSPVGDVALLGLLALMWGSAFPFIETALTGFGPLMLAAGRIAIAAALLTLLAAMRGERVVRDHGARWRVRIAGIVGASAPFALIAWGQLHVTAAESATLMAFTPLATALLAHVFLPDERLGPLLLIGLVLGIVGVATLAGLPQALAALAAPDPLRLAADGAILAGAFGYAASSILLRSVRAGGAIAHAAMMMRWAAVASTLVALLGEPAPANPPAAAVLALVELGLVPSGLAAVVLVRLLQRRSANFVALNNFLVPPVGVLLGVVWLGESVGMREIAGLALLLLALGLAEAGRRRAQPRPR